MRLLILLALVSLTAATSVKGCRDPKGMKKYMVLAYELATKYGGCSPKKNPKNQSLHQNLQIGIGFLVFFGFFLVF